MGFLGTFLFWVLLLLGVLLAALVAWLVAALHFSLRLVRPRMLRMDETRRQAIESGEASVSLLERFSAVTINARDGYALSAGVWPPSGETGQTRTVILCHGHTWTWHGMLKYLGPFLDGSWNILLYNSRGHGGNARHAPTFGQLESRDLADVLVWVGSRFPHNQVTGLFGESMGAAVILQAIGSGLRVDFAICDCAFSNLEELSLIQMRRAGIPALLVPMVLRLARKLVRAMAGFDLAWIKPASAVSHSRVPLLVMHGAKDGLAPVHMAHAIAQAAPGLVKLEILPEGYHASSRASNPEYYDLIVSEFLQEVLRSGARLG